MKRVGLAYHQERDACGVGLVADIKGKSGRAIVADALTILKNLAHRGAQGSDAGTGDGCGILVGLPHAFFSSVCAEQALMLPAPGDYGVGMMFLPTDEPEHSQARQLVDEAIREEGEHVLGWREVPVDSMATGTQARATRPAVWQVFVGRGPASVDHEQFERHLFVLRKQIERRLRESQPGAYVCSFSSRTVVYKGLLQPGQLDRFFVDLARPDFSSYVALVHQRFSTNTFPSWKRAHPYRMIAHNGEINTLRGNLNWMRAREEVLACSRFAGDIAKLRPIIDEDGSDSGMFDNALELLVHSGRSLPHALMMMVPEAWENDAAMPDALRAFYAFHACFMEPWDGPAAIAFSDGKVAGALLDRNGLRPARVLVTEDGRVIVASETGVLPVADEMVRSKGRLRPGEMLLVDFDKGELLTNDAIKAERAAAAPYARWLQEQPVRLADLPDLPERVMPSARTADTEPDAVMQRAFGYTREDLRLLLTPMANDGEEPVGSMGNDAPPAVLSEAPQLFFAYFRQLFAQVTNPPIDPLREAFVMSLGTALGAEASLFEETPLHARKLVLEQPLLDAKEMAKLLALNAPGLSVATLDALFDVPHADDGEATLAEATLAEAQGALEAGIDRLCRAAERAVDNGATILVLTDKRFDAAHAPIPSLLATGAVHHHLIRAGRRTRCGLVVESGEPREVMHMAALLGYGAGAVHPYGALASVAALAEGGLLASTDVTLAQTRYRKAVDKGILKVMSKMGISTLSSYRGAQIFEALGLEQSLVDRYLTWTPVRIAAVGLGHIARATLARHADAFLQPPSTLLPAGGHYQWRKEGETHAYHPQAIALLQHAVRSGKYAVFKRFSAAANEESQRAHTLRGMLRFKRGEAVPLSDVEPVASIVRRFKTGAMSLGSISRETHEMLAVAMNRLGGRSNTGEGGEDPARYVLDGNGDSRRSAIKQVASGRFGVTMDYLTNALELQIKMAQGAKPGEGGQLPGHKVSEYIAELRCSTPGVTLVSPPPHHDIYSIEDLAQLIFDLKSANNGARISVKLVSQEGVGTVAAGVAKAKADVILISGDSGGTGAAPLSSIKHAGIPWEIGLAEAQQVLVKNGLRERVVLETDGQLKTGRDVAIAAVLGAEEFGFATAALVASGCVLMRVCHLNTCPVGIATQDPELRARFAGEPEHVINFMTFVAEELREIMAELGVRTVRELVGRVDLLDAAPAAGLAVDLSGFLHREPGARVSALVAAKGERDAFNERLVSEAEPALADGEAVRIACTVRNVDRAVGTRLSSELTRRRGARALADDTIRVSMQGTAGQSFGAFVKKGITLELEGDANDYFGKGLCGGHLIAYPPRGARFTAEANIIVGNVALYGATAGEVYLRGQAGERFAVRNSGATAVVEGLGDHGCEYMTGGTVLVLGQIGRNFGAGMSGGVGYVFDAQGDVQERLQHITPEALDHDGAERVRGLLLRHFEHTGSRLAWRILADFAAHVPRFWLLMPEEYKRARARLAPKVGKVLAHG